MDWRTITMQQASMDLAREQALRWHCTCPTCRMLWRSDGNQVRDFFGRVVCPDCLHPSVQNPRSTRFAFADTRRLPSPTKERER